jgi:serine protease Do
MWNLLLALAPTLQDPAADEIYGMLQKVDRINPVVLVAQAVTPAVVFIQTEIRGTVDTFPWGPREYRGVGAGSGVVVRPDGFIVTNYHVIRGAQRIQVSFSDDSPPWPAQVVSYKELEDLALLRIVPRDSSVSTVSAANADMPTFPTARMGTSSDLMAGEQVVAIGNPHGQAHTVSSGIISGLHRDIPISDQGLFFSDLIQTDASINFGNSGGPLLNIRGELIGINTAMNTQAENIGFAIPVDRVLEVLNDYLYPQARTSWLGFDLAGDGTMVVDRVWPDSPAEQAGLCEGDRVVAVGELQLETPEDWMNATLELLPNKPVAVHYLRGTRRHEAFVQPWEKVDGFLMEHLGVRFREVTMQSRNWLFVDDVEDGGPGQLMGLRKDDLLLAIEPAPSGNSRPYRVPKKQALFLALQDLRSKTPVGVEIRRDDNGDHEYASEERYQGTIVMR